MDLIKQLTGKNPSEYEPIAKSLIDNSDIDLFSKLVKQDDFLFDFIKENVAKRLQKACNSHNYKNILHFLKYYSPSYDTMFGEVLNSFGGNEIYPQMRNIFLNGTDSEKAYAAKYFAFHGDFQDLISTVRIYAKSEYEPLMANSIELLSIANDMVLRDEALKKLESEDEFEQYEGVRFLVAYGDKESLSKIIFTMKKSAFSESIASEIPYLMPLDEIIDKDSDAGILVLCNIINAIPEIVSPVMALEYDLYNVFEKLLKVPLTSASALVIAMAMDKFNELITNDEYLYDCDKNTKDFVYAINDLLKQNEIRKLKSYLYDELYEESDFVFFALDYVDDIEELETLLDSKNQTLILKALTILKERSALDNKHKEIALQHITSDDIKLVINAL